VGALGGWTGKIAATLRAQAHRKPPASLEAYDLYLIGLEAKHAFTLEKSREAITTLRKAVELDPGFARGWAALGLAYNAATMNGFADDPTTYNRLWIECTEKAVALDRGDALARANLGLARPSRATSRPRTPSTERPSRSPRTTPTSWRWWAGLCP
jgi:Flp pilus assembly protein TadD